MSRPADWLDFEEALARILDAVPLLPAERLPLERAAGRVLAESVVSPLDHPPWDNSAMDGFAVRSVDIDGASADAPVELEVVEAIAAGATPDRALSAGQAAKIMTGAPVPEGADAVVRVEHTDAWTGEGWRAGDGARVRVLRDDDARRNIRRRGEDLRRGSPVLAEGVVLGAGQVGLLAAVGRDEALVVGAPRVALLANGDELVPTDRLEEAIEGRAIVDSNSHALAAATRLTGGTPVMLGIAADDEAAILERVGPALDEDALVTTAGASVGERDLLRGVLESLGLELDFWRVRIRPGSPFWFGSIPRTGRPPLPVFGLAGNPASAAVTFHVLVAPALRRMMGRRDARPAGLLVSMAEPIPSRVGLTHLLRVRLEPSPEGLRARLAGPQGSGLLVPLAAADALLVVPEGRGGFESGDQAVALPLGAPERWSPAPLLTGGG